jgi:hypothetical protein
MRDVSFPDAIFAGHQLEMEAPRSADVRWLSELARKAAPTADPQFQITNESDWRKLITAEDIVCAKTRDGRIAGIYATNQFSSVRDPATLAPIRAAHSVLCNRYKLSERNVSFGAVTLIDNTWQFSDLRSHLLRALLRQVGFRYRYLFTAVRKNSLSEMHLLPNEGWRCFHEEDDTCYMMLDVARALRQLASTLVLRIPNRTESASANATRA